MNSLNFYAIPLMLVLILAGCSRDKPVQVVREDLFTLDIGRQEDQIALYDLDGDQGIPRTDISMRDGLFYIADGNGEKIVRYNSYGDLLFMIYNEETNPVPLSLRPMQESGVVTRWTFHYPFLEPSKIAVDSRKHIYAADKLPFERHSFDSENKALLDSIILHFDEKGDIIEYLGQEGKGGSPFPRISGIYTSIRDEFAVVCRLSKGWNIYWFDANGTVLFLISIPEQVVPVPVDREMAASSVDSLFVAPDDRKIYFKVDYYRDTYDESTGIRTGNEPDSSIIWIMNVEDGSYAGTLEVPLFEYTFIENNRRVTEKMFYSFLGVMQGGRAFLSFPVEGGYSILIMSSEFAVSNEQRQGFIQVGSEELLFNIFDLSDEGILSALLLDDWQAKVVWWRTDKLIGDNSP
ncbi:MAG: hypothetical protein LBQ88_17215 [Treponema sp.]|jgi:hypothetical protein|nr:hypothetical protein [Treponema sp.]